jgi:hypothetical protein
MTDDPTRRTDSTGPTEPAPTEDAGPTTPTETAPYEPAPVSSDAQAPAVQPTEAAPATGPGSPRARWLVAGGVAVLAIAVTVGAFLLLGASPSPAALRYIPGNSALVAEVRLDLPGDQMQKAGNLLAHFPGFRDQSTLTEKLDEAFSRFVGAVTQGGVDYRTELKPWINGPIFVAASAEDLIGQSADPKSVIVSATTNGAVECETALETATVSHETYRGLDLVIASGGDLAGIACVIDGRQAVIGQVERVKAALDAKSDGTGMDKSELYRVARAALSGDRLATIFVAGAPLRDAGPAPSFAVPGMGALESLVGAVPDWTMIGLRAEDDALVVDSVTAPVPAPTSGPSLLALPPTHASVLTAMLPADTVLFIEDQGTGVTLQNLLATLRADPALGSALAMLDGLGGANELVGWIDDAGIAIVGGPDTPAGGILLVARDEAAAADRVATLNNVLALIGLSGEGIEVRQTTINGVDVTTVVITDLSAIIPPGTLPDGVLPPATGPIEFSIAAKGRVLLLGVGEQFMTGILNVPAGASLADQVGFKHAVERGLPGSRATVYVAAPGALDLVERYLPADVLAQWQSDALPYVDPLEALAISSTSDPAANRSRIVITVTQALP